jgi:universal stress protein E
MMRNTTVQKLTSILVVIDRTDETRHVVAKSMILARHFGARLELFLCDSEQSYALRHSYDAGGIASARQTYLAEGDRYLDALRRSLAEDVAISVHVACESPLYEAIVHRVQAAQPDLVIKRAAGNYSTRRFALDANDWQLARTCPVPLMLTHGLPWSAQPCFAAAVDMSDRDDSGLACTIIHAASYLALGCRAQLEVMYSDRAAGDAKAHDARTEDLRRLVDEFHVDDKRLHVLQGEAEDTLPTFIARKHFDALVLGALTRRRGRTALVGTLTSKLLEALECDVVLVKPDSYLCRVPEAVRTVAG